MMEIIDDPLLAEEFEELHVPIGRNEFDRRLRGLSADEFGLYREMLEDPNETWSRAFAENIASSVYR